MPPSPDSNFTVTSGALCFGNRREVGVGSQSEIQAPSCPKFECGGGGATVLSHAWKYNLRALNGRWDVYLLVDAASRNLDTTSSGGTSSSGAVKGKGGGGRVVAAFVCHESLTNDVPYLEAKRIVDVANAPWEKDSGTNRNTPQTWDGRVLVVNRYDWDEDYYGEEEDGIDNGEEALVGAGQRNSRYLVDYNHAGGESVDKWCEDGGGVRLVVFGEYIYGRFGLVEDRSAVHSFLFFTNDTNLAQTTFRGDEERCVYVPLSPEERHIKRLADGSYTGYEWLRTACKNDIPEDGLVDPFGVDIVSLDDVEEILKAVQPQVVISAIEPQLREDVMQLINEALAVWIVSLKSAAESSSSREEFLAQAFPKANRQGVSIDSLIVQAIQKDNGMTISQDSTQTVLGRDFSSVWDHLSLRELSCGIRCILGEVMELAVNCARNRERTVLVPYDIRIAISNDEELCEKRLNGSTTFWPPDVVEELTTSHD